MNHIKINMTRLLTLLAIVFATTTAGAQVAQVTFLHNAADPTLAVVDLYVSQSGNTTKVEDLAFQKASPLSEAFIFGGIEVTFSIAPSTSTSEAEKLLSYSFTPNADAGYIVIAQGVASSTGYVPNPDGKNISASMSHFEVPLFSGNPNQTGVMFAHGATDLEKCDVYSRGGATPLFRDLIYSEHIDTMKNVDRKRTTFDLTKVGDKKTVYASFEVDFASYSSETIVLVVSGFKTPNDNNNATTPLALLAVLEDGSVVKNDLIAGSQTARVQIVHNAADPAAASVDIWVDGVKSIDNLAFRKASAFTDLPAGSPLTIGFAPATSTAYKDTIKTVVLPALRPGRSYHLIAQGVVDTSKFAKNPGGRDIALNIFVAEGALEKSSETGKTSVRSAHGATDAPTVRIEGSLANYTGNVSYGDITSEYINVTPSMDTLWLVSSDSGKKIKGWEANFAGSDRATMVLASGFLDPVANNNGPAFKLILVDASGNVNDRLTEVNPPVTSVEEEDIVPATLWRLMPNPANDQFTLSVPLTADLVKAHGMLLTAQVFTSQGVLVGVFPMQTQGLNATVTVPTSAIAQGSYYVHVTTAGGVHVGAGMVQIAR